MKKKIAGICLAFALLLTLLPVQVYAATVVASGTCGDPSVNNGEDLTWSLDSDGVLTISGTGEMADYGYFNVPWTMIRDDSIQTLIINSGVTSIGDNAFYGCSSLTSVTIPAGMTSVGDNAFFGCRSLTSVTIPDSVTSIGNYAFDGCESLTSVTIPAGVTSIGSSTFSGCESLTSVTIPAGVTSIGNDAFSGCRSLTSVTIPASVTSIGRSAFYGCKSLTSVTIPAGVTSIGNNTFYGCKSLTSVTIPDSVTSIGNYTFSGCSSLTSVTIPDSVTSVGNDAFSGCSSLTSVTIPAGVTSIGKSAFFGCDNLTSVTISNSVTSIEERAFGANIRLTAISVRDGNTAYNSKDGVLFSADGTLLHSYPAGKPTQTYTIPAGVTSIGDSAFYGCDNLTSVTIPTGVRSIGHNAFYGCKSLTSVTIPAGVTSIGAVAFYGCANLTSVTIPASVTSIGNSAFFGCANLTRITIPASVTSIGLTAFMDTSALTDIYFGGTEAEWNAAIDGVGDIGIADNVTIHFNDLGAGSVTNDSVNILSVTPASIGRGEAVTVEAVVNYSLSSVENGIVYLGVNSQRENSYQLVANKTVSAGSGTVTLSAAVTTAADWDPVIYANLSDANHGENWTPLATATHLSSVAASGNCGTAGNDSSVKWSLSTSGVLTISGTGAMADYSTDSATIPWNSYASQIKSIVVRSGVTRIGNCAFDGCVNLTDVSIADSVTRIGNGAFYKCSKLTHVTIPVGVTSIGDDAFNSCTSLTSVTIPASVISIGTGAFWRCTGLTSMTISANMTSIGEAAFFECISLTSVTIPAGVTSIGDYAFSGCANLTSVTIPDSVTSIGDGTFSGCKSLKSFTIPAGIASISSTAFDDSGLSSIKVAAGNTSFVAEDNVLYNAGKTQLIYYPKANTRSSYILPDTISTVLLEQLSGPNLSEIRIPKGVIMTCDNVVTGSTSNTNPITLYFEGDIPSSIENWAFKRNNEVFVHVNAQKWIYNRVEKAIPDAVLYVPYVYDIKDDTLVVSINCNGLEDSGLEVSNDGIISGAPLETGKHVFKVSSRANTYTLAVDVKTNNETAVDAMNSEELVIEKKIPNMVSTNLKNQVFEIEDEEKDQGQSNFSKFRKVYLDGVELTGGKVGVGETYTSVDSIPTDWQYYAEEGSTKITVLAQTFQNLSAGTHLIAATFVQTKTDAKTGKEVEVQHVAAQNFTISTNSGNNGENTRNNDRDYSSDSSDSSDSSSSQTTNRIADQGAIKDGKLSYTMAKGVATLAKYTSKQLSEAASQQKSSVFTIDLTRNGERVTKVSLPEGMMNQLAQLTANESNTVKSVRIVLSSGVIELDVSALAEIAKQIGGKAVSVSVDEVKVEQLPAEQQKAISELNAEKLVSIEIACGNQQVSDFGGGRVIISIPFARHSDRNMRGYAVWHISEEGNAARHSTGFAEEQLSFRTAHLSIYAVAYQEAKLFNDVPDGTWYTHDVDHVAGLKLMNGVGNNWFGANEELSRAMFAQIIYNAEKGEAGAESVFADVSDDAWYADAVNWAAKAGIVGGIGNGEFAPERNITREELVTMLYKYAGYKNYALTNSTSLSRFEDGQKVSDWARTAMEWAVGNMLINGINEEALSANSSATRAQTAKVLTYFLEQYEK